MNVLAARGIGVSILARPEGRALAYLASPLKNRVFCGCFREPIPRKPFGARMQSIGTKSPRRINGFAIRETPALSPTLVVRASNDQRAVEIGGAESTELLDLVGFGQGETVEAQIVLGKVDFRQ